MSSPEEIFEKQCDIARNSAGAVDFPCIARLVVETYARHQTLISSATRRMKQVRAHDRALALELQDIKDAADKRNVLLEAMVHNLPTGISLFDEEARLIIANRNFTDILGIPVAAAIPGTPFDDLRQHIRGSERRMAERDEASAGRMHHYEWTMEDGRIIEVILSFLEDGRYVALHRDVTEERQVAARIHHIAHHDPLTDLPNRLELAARLEAGLAGLGGGRQAALLLINLDYFKGINDTFGASTGDIVLQQVASRLSMLIAGDDVLARLGSDEFAIFQMGDAQPAGALALAEAIISQLSYPISVAEKQIVLSASVGIAVAPDYGRQTNVLLKNAGMALSRAKADGRKTLRFYDPDMDAQMQQRRRMETDLRKAIHNSEFELHYQPIYDINEKRVIAREALIRWNHPERGRIAPADFIPLAEEMGLIVDIGKWVLSQACRDAASWDKDIKVSVNISPIQFGSITLLDDIMLALHASCLSPDRLDLEVTESVLIKHQDETIALLHDIKLHGISVSMDDFGTGYSSLSYLRSFPFDKIKIDRSFVADIAGNEQALALMRAIIYLARSLGMTVTVEGVETEEQFRILRNERCDQIQGYFVQRPAPNDAPPVPFQEPL